jgi:serine protease Do
MEMNMSNTPQDPHTPLGHKPRSRPAARRIALMAGAAALVGLTAAGTQWPAHFDVFAPAQAQVSAAVGRAEQPVGFADIVQRVKPSVISVKVRLGNRGEGEDAAGSPMERFFQQFGDSDGPRQGPPMRRGRGTMMGQGSGFFISADGFAVTNNHVVEGADKVEVTTDDGKTYSAKVIGTDPRTDLALIKVEGGSDFPYAKLSDGKPRIGDWVLAVGNPFGLGGTVTAGIVSANGRDIGNGPYDNFMQIDAPVNKGNSGGPAFNMQGEVAGVNTAIYSPSGGSVGIAFAIPASTVKTVVAQLKDRGTVTRGWIGVQVQPVTPEIADSLGLKSATGALVADPQPDSPAARAGIAAGDIITAVNGASIKDSRELARTIAGYVPGNSVKLDVTRNGQSRTVDVTLGKLPDQQVAAADAGSPSAGAQASPDVPRLGLSVAPAAEAGRGRNGVVVTDIDPDGAAAAQGIRRGDVILDVAGKPVQTPADIRTALSSAAGGQRKSVLMRVQTGDASRFIAVPLHG